MDPGLVSLSLSLNGRDVHMSGSPCASGMLITASCLGGRAMCCGTPDGAGTLSLTETGADAERMQNPGRVGNSRGKGGERRGRGNHRSVTAFSETHVKREVGGGGVVRCNDKVFIAVSSRPQVCTVLGSLQSAMPDSRQEKSWSGNRNLRKEGGRDHPPLAVVAPLLLWRPSSRGTDC
jgi:hypothetical protein